MTLVFYISGHGYGHAVRDAEIMAALLGKCLDLQIHIRTAAPDFIFAELPKERITLHRTELDFGVLQRNSFHVDREGTLKHYAELVSHKDRLIEAEAAFLSKVSADVILSDITPLAFDAAVRYGKPAVAVGNFSWDWIYAEYLKELPQYAFVVEEIRASYRQAERLLRLPFYGDMTVFRNIENVPLVARRAKLPKEEARKRLGLSANASARPVLLGLRMSDFEGVDWRRVETIENVVFVAVSRDVPLKNCIHVGEDRLPFVEVLNACDAVLSKPGYSIVAEAIANRTPLLYVPRCHFVEDPVLIQGLNDYAVCEELSHAAFYAGDWQEALERLFNKPPVWPLIRCDGAAVVAERIVDGRKAPQRPF